MPINSERVSQTTEFSQIRIVDGRPKITITTYSNNTDEIMAELRRQHPSHNGKDIQWQFYESEKVGSGGQKTYEVIGAFDNFVGNSAST